MIRLALRFDDPSATSRHDLEMELFALLERYGVPATAAVIPIIRSENSSYPLEASNAGHLIDACRKGVIEIAQHGYSHEARGKTSAGNPSEFTGLTVSEQARLIGEGRIQLGRIFGTEISGFVPPWNSCDGTTLDVLEQLGFAYISSGKNVSRRAAQLLQLPRNCNLQDIRDVVVAARRFGFLNPVAIAVMHHYDFVESGSDRAKLSLPQFADLLDWLATQHDVKMVTLGEIARSRAAYFRCDDWEWGLNRLPWRVRKWLPERCMLQVPFTGNA